jgi:sulfite reductase (NADPH) hemoprotein beta-component
VAAIAAAVAATSLRGPGILPAVAPPSPALAGEYAAWARSNLRPQRQPGFALATIRLPLGDVTGVQLRVLAELAQAYGDGTVRTTPEQNLVLRHLPLAEAPELHRRLQAAGLARAGAGTLEDVTSCPGAEACRIAVTQSRGLAELLGEHLRARPELAAAAPGVDVKISGCPNGCGQHHVAGIGFQGSVRRLGSRVVPQYFVLLGGGTDSGGARFGRLAAKVPARRVGQVIERLIALYVAERSAGETAAEFLRRAPLDVVKALLADLEAITLETAVAEDFVDLGEQAEFVVETQAGECVA